MQTTPDMETKNNYLYTIKLAHDYYDTAYEQYCKPEEDLVPYMVCRSAYKSVGNYLAAYMFHRGLMVKDEMTLQFLLKSCQDLNPAFNELDLDLLFYGNAHHEEVLFADDVTMHKYMDLSTATRDLVAREIQNEASN
ncbi:MAG: hypothetical protein H6606_09085 [Flavobacteriales bacterium]|nr:hypothetical protein [Flavobacteriales bacterium]